MSEKSGEQSPLISRSTEKSVDPGPDPKAPLKERLRETLLGKTKHGLRACLAEMVGLALFVFIGVMSVATTSLTDESTLLVGTAHGFTIALLVASFGNVSGGHFNPAVSLGVFLCGGIHGLLFVLYVIFQNIGAILGAALARVVLDYDLYPNSNDSISVYDSIDGGTHYLPEGIDDGQALLAEVILTTILVLTVLMTAVDTNSNYMAPLAIGLAVFVDILAGGNITGASMNPARSFGPMVVYDDDDIWDDQWIYWVGPALGALLASTLYRLFFGNDKKRLMLKAD